MKTMLKTGKVLVAYILALSLFGTTSAAAVSEEAVGELLYENGETYITSYNLETGEQYVSKLSDMIGEDNIAAYADQEDITVPAVPPRNGPSWPTAEEGISPQYIFGGGYEWQECDPYIWGVARIVTTWPDGDQRVGTAFVFADNALLTAAHCIYNNKHGGKCIKVEISPAQCGESFPFGTIKGTWIHKVTGYDYPASGFYKHDYAVIEADENIGAETGLFGYTSTASRGQTINVTGYPCYLDNDGKILVDERQYIDIGTIFSLQSNYFVTKDLDWTDGNSGGPVYTDDYLAVGIVSVSDKNGNYATRITPDIVKWLRTFRT